MKHNGTSMEDIQIAAGTLDVADVVAVEACLEAVEGDDEDEDVKEEQEDNRPEQEDNAAEVAGKVEDVVDHVRMDLLVCSVMAFRDTAAAAAVEMDIHRSSVVQEEVDRV